jgi:hypothetical protein
MNIVDAMHHPNLFASIFENDDNSWSRWETALRAMFALPMSEDELPLYTECTGRTIPPEQPFKEAYFTCGRRAGKSFIMSLTAVFLACFFDYSPFLNVGERATIMVIGADRKQTRTIMRFIHGLFQNPTLAKLLETERAESFDLKNNVVIEVHTASFQTTRGYTVVAALLDEIAFIGGTGDDSALSDTELLRALRPAMALIPNAMLICASSPFARKGVLWQAYEKHYGKNDSNVLVWKAPTTTMNPLFPQRIVDEACAEDIESAKSEYLAEFRNDIASYVDRNVVESLILRGVNEIPFYPGQQYYAFVDPSGGHSDSFTLGIATGKVECGVRSAQLVCLREFKPPFVPSQVIQEISHTIRSYCIYEATSDRYAGEFPAEQFRNFGITINPSEKPKSDIYRDALPLLNSGRVELLDNTRLVNQICNLERRVARGGRDSIDHPSGTGPSAHDDLANSALGAIVLASGITDSFNLDEWLRCWDPTRLSYHDERIMLENERKRLEAERKAKEEAEQRAQREAENCNEDETETK